MNAIQTPDMHIPNSLDKNDNETLEAGKPAAYML